MGVSLKLEANWRGMEGAKLLDARHAALGRLGVDKIRSIGWEAWPERTFNIWGERGSIDILAWHDVGRALLAIEVKTRLPDLQDLLSTMDRKRRLLPAIAKANGLKPLVLGSVLLLPEETWARNRLREFEPVFDAALPARTVEVRNWLEKPSGDLRGIWFLLNSNPRDPKRRLGGETRVPAARRTGAGRNPELTRASGGPKRRQSSDGAEPGLAGHRPQWYRARSEAETRSPLPGLISSETSIARVHIEQITPAERAE